MRRRSTTRPSLDINHSVHVTKQHIRSNWLGTLPTSGAGLRNGNIWDLVVPTPSIRESTDPEDYRF